MGVRDIKESKLKIAQSKMNKILKNLNRYKLNSSYTSRLNFHKKNGSWSGFCAGSPKCLLTLIVLMWFLLFGFLYVYEQYLQSKNCELELPSSVRSLFRPPADCNLCSRVDQVMRVANITAREFEYRYADGMTPVIVEDATFGWKAMTDFNFSFFADFYRKGRKGRKTNDCSYFPYKSGLDSLHEVFSMDEARANLTGEPWYVGWSTCYDEETRALRDYYSRPYFLPETAESDMVDWIFMGGPGQGAPLHLDSVRHVSWQAQISGRKLWQFVPPHECIGQCYWLEYTVAPGEILVVDTNRWYHSTQVLNGDISITIGAEYD